MFKNIKSPYLLCFWILAAFSLIVGLLVGAFYNQFIDIISFHIPWSKALQQGLFSAYQNCEILNYPPLFPFLLWTVSPFLNAAFDAEFWQGTMLLLKLYPVLFNVAIGVVSYYFLRKESEKFAFLCGCLWLFNPSAIFSASFWGQTDTLLMFFILVMFFMLHKQKPIWAALFFTLGCLCKLQMLYFAPIIALELFFNYKPSIWLKSIGLGILTFGLSWLPFMIGSSNMKLPFDIYFGGFNQYNYINLFAGNIFGFFPDLNFKNSTDAMFAGISFNQISTIITILVIVLIVAFYIYLKKKNIKSEPVIIATIMMEILFLFNTKMHERYQLPVLVLTFLCLMIYKNKVSIIVFVSMSIITLLNQSMVIFHENYHGFFTDIVPYEQFFISSLNFALLIFVIVSFFVYIKKSNQKQISM